MAKDPTDELIELEHALWRAETRFDDEFMERILADDFGEFGRSGRVYARADTLAVDGQDLGATGEGNLSGGNLLGQAIGRCPI